MQLHAAFEKGVPYSSADAAADRWKRRQARYEFRQRPDPRFRRHKTDDKSVEIIAEDVGAVAAALLIVYLVFPIRKNQPVKQ